MNGIGTKSKMVAVDPTTGTCINTDTILSLRLVNVVVNSVSLRVSYSLKHMNMGGVTNKGHSFTTLLFTVYWCAA
jgi:hypothetical protein